MEWNGDDVKDLAVKSALIRDMARERANDDMMVVSAQLACEFIDIVKRTRQSYDYAGFIDGLEEKVGGCFKIMVENIQARRKRQGY